MSIPRKVIQAQSLFNRMTPSEKALWRRLKRPIRGLYFEPQAVIGGYIVDFYCEQAKIAIEVDGRCHDFDKDYERDSQLSHMGVLVLRFQNPRNQVEVNSIVSRIYSEARYRYRRSKSKFLHNSATTRGYLL